MELKSRLWFCLVTIIVFSCDVEGKRRRKVKVALEDIKEESRQGRLFSLFNVVQFNNDACTSASDSNLVGTCLSTSECSDQGGKQDGNCAAGFGACCTFFKSSCNDNINKNCTYVQNSGFPSAANITGACQFNFDRIQSDICQLRLDFDTLTTVGPDVTGVCGAGGTSDIITVTSPTGDNPPVVCGTLTGQHMYVETGSTGTAGSLDLNIGTTVAIRSFRIKVTFLECSSKSLAPSGCTQYLTTSAGSFQSYNFQGGQIMEGLDYSTCIRREAGFCGINFVQSAMNIGGPSTFELFGGTANTASTMSEGTCPQSYIEIPSSAAVATTGRFCGGVLSSTLAATVPGIVQSTTTPFTLLTFTATNLMTVAISGYSLDFAQTPC